MYTIKKQTYDTPATGESDIVGLFHEFAVLYDRYRRQINTAVVVILTVLVLVGGYSLYQESRDKKASALLAQAMDAYRASQTGDEKALELFKKVRASYGGTLSADIAQYYSGNCLMTMGRNQEALAEYQDLVKRSGVDKELKGIAYQRIGYAQAALGSAEESLKAFEQAEALLGPGIATLEAARTYEALGKAEEAKKKYNAVAAVLPGSVPAGMSASPKFEKTGAAGIK